MGLGIRIRDLEKIYTSAPPMALSGVRGAAFARPAFRRREKQKPRIVALGGISLDVHPGEVFGLLGPNGAGKSTTIGILTTRVRPTGGEAWIGEHNVWRDRIAAKRLIGVVPQRPNLDFSLTAREVLTFHAAYFNVPPADRAARASALLEQFKLTDRADDLLHGFSGGMMQRLSIARAMMLEPEVMFLDEPSAGLDPQTRLLLWDLVRGYNRAGKTILITTHNMEEADALCDRLAIVDRGRIIASGTPAELKRSVPGGFLLRLQFDRPTAVLVDPLRDVAGVTEIRPDGESGLYVYADRGGSLVPEIITLATGAGIALHDLHISEPSLENLFLHHTGRSLRD
jgi:ABC-2 type transport system ATP-binding protein